MKHANQYFKNQINADALQQSAIADAEELDDDIVIAITRQEAEAALHDMIADGCDELPDIDIDSQFL